MLTITGYVTGDPAIQDGDYGRFVELSVRWKTGNGKQTHWAAAKIYGKKIEVAMKYIRDGDQITISGTVNSIKNKTKKDATEYCQFYMDCAEFSIPPSERKDVGAPSPASAPVRTSPAPQRPLLQRQDPPDDDDDFIPF
jgi:single-stranded DNA-binding protein